MKENSISSIVNYVDFAAVSETKLTEIVQDFNLSFEWDYQDYLKIIKTHGLIENFDQLFNESKNKFIFPSDKSIVSNQPTWNIDEVENFDGKENDTSETETSSGENNCFPEDGRPIFDIPAWYQPAHYNPVKNYGIYITKWGIASYAKSIREYNQNITLEEALVSALAILWWHELTHAWVEDLSSMIESLTGADHYTSTTKKYMGYIFMEEAICNSSAFGNLASVLDERKPIGGADFKPNTIINKNIILDAVKKMFKKSRKGYSDFYPFDCWVDVEPLFFKNIARLLKDIYNFEGISVQHAIASFFDTARIVEREVFSKKNKDRLHHIDYGAYGHVHRWYLKETDYHANTLRKIGGELYYKHSIYGVHIV